MSSLEELLEGVGKPLPVKSSKRLLRCKILVNAPKAKSKKNLGYANLSSLKLKKKRIFQPPKSLDKALESLVEIETKAVVPIDEGQICPYFLAQKLVKNYSFATRSNNLFVYDEQCGYYRCLKYGNGIGSFDMLVRMSVSKEEAVKINSYFIKETRPWILSAEDIIKLPEFNDDNYIAFENGTLDLNEWTLKAHSERYRLTANVKCRYVEYDKDEIYDTRFWRYINRLADYREEVVEALRFMIGLALSNIRRLKMAFFVFGEASNGKSVLANLLVNLLGTDNVTSVNVSKISERFFKAELFEKLALISSDENTDYWNQENATTFKQVVSRDWLTGEYKGQDPFQFRPNCLVICMANDYPRYTADVDKGNAISERIFAIPTGASIPKSEQNRHLLEILMKEKDVIASWAVDGLRDLVFYEKIPEVLVEMSSSVDELDPMSIFEKWLAERVELSPESVTKSSEFYQNYAEYFQTVNQCRGKALIERAFYMQLAKKYGEFKQKVGTVNCYKGLKIKEE